jgi:tetrahydromethanopterin S-methyltransferase subunit B
MKIKQKNRPFDHHAVERQNNIVIGIAVGVMIMACAALVVFNALMSV